jgi:uncharacterized protein
MLKSSPPLSNIESSGPPTPERNSPGRRSVAALVERAEQPWPRRIARATRWLHVYLSMLGLAVVLFFGVTGITLNHPNWFGGDLQTTSSDDGTLDVTWVDAIAPGVDPAHPEAATLAVDKLRVVELLRSAHGVRGAVRDFTVDEHECVITFKGPGYAADAFIDRDTGHYTLTETRLGWVAIVNDLHKGRDTGPVWSVVIDVSAFLTTIAALSGLVLLYYVNRRWTLGMSAALVGSAAVVLVFLFGVP